MTPTDQEQKAAMKWLERQIRENAYGVSFPGSEVHGCWKNLSILKTMLAEPRLPECATDAALNAMASEVAKYAASDAYNKMNQAHAYRAMRAHLTKPKKMKPVFKLEGGYNPRHPTIPGTQIEADWHDVNQAIAALCNDGYETVTVRREMVPEDDRPPAGYDPNTDDPRRRA